MLSLRIEDTAKTTAEAQKNVDEKVKEIKELIQSYNIANSNIKTTNMNVYEAYDWTDI
ncbi:SIMPL domain-containing protein [bacterium]|nr:SIMPL domain-containing protein [bacterium]